MTILISIGFFASFICGIIVMKYHSETVSMLYHKFSWRLDNVYNDWNNPFKIVTIVSSLDGKIQKAIYYKTTDNVKKPLLVSLHTWGGDYRERDPLAKFIVKNNWNYIHPDFRGPNRTQDACLCKKVIKDIDDAIQFALKYGNVDKSNIFIVGASGGGYATIGYFMRGEYTAKSYLAWVPITDLIHWYWQSKNRKSMFAHDILKCTSSGNNSLDVIEAKNRSPIYWEVTQRHNSTLEIYAGIDDGYTGSVPISHSILFFNRLVSVYGFREKRVPENDIVKLLTKAVENDTHLGKIGDRTVLYARITPVISLIIFDGGHEMLSEYCFKRIKKLAEQ